VLGNLGNIIIKVGGDDRKLGKIVCPRNERSFVAWIFWILAMPAEFVNPFVGSGDVEGRAFDDFALDITEFIAAMILGFVGI
jgi:hypothetical protein